MAYAKRIDQNQNQIVKLARDMGVSVAITSMVGQGFPDTVWGLNGLTCLVEIKDGSKPPSKRKLNENEQKFHDNWRGHVCIIENVDQAIQLINKLRRVK